MREHKAGQGTGLWQGYIVAVAGTALAALVRWALGQAVGEIPHFVTFYPVVLAAAVVGGTGPGLLATILGALAVALLFPGPVGNPGPSMLAEAVGMGLFIAVSCGISILGGRLRAAHQRACRQARDLDEVLHMMDLANVLVRDLDDRITRWNSGSRRLYGFTRDQALGRISHELLHTRFPQPLVQIRATLFQTGHWEGELVHTRADGRDVIVFSEWVLHPDAGGAPTAIVEVNADITGLRHQEARARLAAVVESSEDAIVSESLDGTLTSWNPAAERLYGYRPDHIIGHPLADLIPPERQDENTATLERLRKGERIPPYESTRVARDGRRFDVLVTLSPLRDLAGRIIGASEIVRDITDRKRAADRQAALLAQVQAANRELNDFATIVSHDLKTPLRGVATLAQWLQSDYAAKLDDEGRDHLAEIVKRISRMHRMIDDILQYSRAGRANEKAESVALAQLVSEVVQDLAPPAHVCLRIAPGLPVVPGEPVQLRQVFQNLIGNAIKYANKPQVEIQVRWADGPSLWWFSVADNGPGIEARHFERIFQLFQTLAPRDETDSTGVGLALVKRTVEGAGGRVWVESRLGKGSTFHFTWPKRLPAGPVAHGGDSVERMAA